MVDRAEGLAVAALLLLGSGLRLLALDQWPRSFSYDEAAEALSAMAFVRGALANMFATGLSGAPTMFFYLMSGPLAFAPDTVAAARLVPALLGTATLATTYLLARVLCGRLVALAALGFLATFDFHLFFSRLASHNVADGLFVSATLGCLYLALTRGRPADYAAAGISSDLPSTPTLGRGRCS